MFLYYLNILQRFWDVGNSCPVLADTNLWSWDSWHGQTDSIACYGTGGLGPPPSLRNCLWIFWGEIGSSFSFGGDVARHPFSSSLLLLIFYCLNDPALRYSLLQSNLALPRCETWALAVPRRRPAHLAGDGENLYFNIFIQLRYSEFCCPTAVSDRCLAGADLFLLLTRQSKRQSNEKLDLVLLCSWRGWLGRGGRCLCGLVPFPWQQQEWLSIVRLGQT